MRYNYALGAVDECISIWPRFQVVIPFLLALSELAFFAHPDVIGEETTTTTFPHTTIVSFRVMVDAAQKIISFSAIIGLGFLLKFLFGDSLTLS